MRQVAADLAHHLRVFVAAEAFGNDRDVGFTESQQRAHFAFAKDEVERLDDLNATVRVVGKTVFVTGYQGTVASLDVESGQVLWARQISSYSSPGVDLTQLYIADSIGELHGLARSTGQELWRDGSLLYRGVTGPAASGDSVVVGDFEGYLHWFDAATGVLRARTRAGSNSIIAAPLVVNDLLLVLNDGGKLYAFKEAGSK